MYLITWSCDSRRRRLVTGVCLAYWNIMVFGLYNLVTASAPQKEAMNWRFSYIYALGTESCCMLYSWKLIAHVIASSSILTYSFFSSFTTDTAIMSGKYGVTCAQNGYPLPSCFLYAMSIPACAYTKSSLPVDVACLFSAFLIGLIFWSSSSTLQRQICPMFFYIYTVVSRVARSETNHFNVSFDSHCSFYLIQSTNNHTVMA
jgi:hypothetical protein